jgi:hypothetical protein
MLHISASILETAELNKDVLKQMSFVTCELYLKKTLFLKVEVILCI